MKSTPFSQLTGRTQRVECKVFEDNHSCIAIAKAPKLTPCTKHIALKYHHFRGMVEAGIITIEPIGTKDQIADILAKPLRQIDNVRIQQRLIGW